MDLSFNKNNFLTSLKSFFDCEATLSSENSSNNEASSHPPLLSVMRFMIIFFKRN